MTPDQPSDSPTEGQEHHGGALHDAHSRGGIRLRRWAVPALIVLFWLFVVGPLGSFAGQLSDVQENDAAGFLPASAESTQVQELSQGLQPPATPCPRSSCTSSTRRSTRRTWPRSRPTSRGSPRFPESPSRSSDRSRARTAWRPPSSPTWRSRPTSSPAPRCEAIRTILEDSPARALGAEIFVTGPAGVLADFAEAFGEIDGILLLVALGVVLVILLIVYRSPVLPFIVLHDLDPGAGRGVVRDLPARRERRHHPQRPEPGDPVHPRHRGHDRLLPAAGGALPGGAAPNRVPGRRDARDPEGHRRGDPGLRAARSSWAS